MVYWNRGLISSQEHLPTNSGTSGVYDLTSQQIYTSESQWPEYDGIVQSGLRVYLDSGNSNSYSGTGTTWYDLSGNGNHATLVNGPTWNSTYGFHFDGSNDYAEISSFDIPARPYTISVWVSHSNAFSLSSETYIYQAAASGTNPAVSFTKNGYFGGRTVELTNQLVSGSTGSSNVVGSTAVMGYIFYNITAVASTTDLRIYLNGTLDNSASSSGAVVSKTGNTIIGKPASSSSGYFYGDLSEVMIYNRALSATEVTHNFDAVKSNYGL